MNLITEFQSNIESYSRVLTISVLLFSITGCINSEKQQCYDDLNRNAGDKNKCQDLLLLEAEREAPDSNTDSENYSDGVETLQGLRNLVRLICYDYLQKEKKCQEASATPGIYIRN